MAEYSAFFTTYMGVTDEITTPASLVPLRTTDPAVCGLPFEIEALWDTGAMSTFIKPALCERLKLRSLESGRTKFASVGGVVGADVTGGRTVERSSNRKNVAEKKPTKGASQTGVFRSPSRFSGEAHTVC